MRLSCGANALKDGYVYCSSKLRNEAVDKFKWFKASVLETSSHMMANVYLILTNTILVHNQSGLACPQSPYSSLTLNLCLVSVTPKIVMK